jgi:hypothetical protein
LKKKKKQKRNKKSLLNPTLDKKEKKSSGLAIILKLKITMLVIDLNILNLGCS